MGCEIELYLPLLPLGLFWLILPWLSYQWKMEAPRAVAEPGCLGWIKGRRHGLGVLGVFFIDLLLTLLNGILLDCTHAQVLLYVNWGLLVIVPCWIIAVLCCTKLTNNELQQIASLFFMLLLIFQSILIIEHSKHIFGIVPLVLIFYLTHMARERKYQIPPLVSLGFYVFVFVFDWVVPHGMFYTVWLLTLPLVWDLGEQYKIFYWLFPCILSVFYAIILVSFVVLYSITFNQVWFAALYTYTLFFFMWHLYGSLYNGTFQLQSTEVPYYDEL